MREFSPSRSLLPELKAGVPAYKFDEGPVRAEDVATAVAALRKSLRVMIFMAVVIMRPPNLQVPYGRAFATDGG